jgi:multidrug resistance protein, MATE family
VSLLTVVAFNFMSFPFGIATAATIRVGNLLGAGRPEAARSASWLAVALGSGSMALCAAAMLAARNYLAAIFIDDAEVAKLSASVALIGCTMEVLDGAMGTAQARPLAARDMICICRTPGHDQHRAGALYRCLS